MNKSGFVETKTNNVGFARVVDGSRYCLTKNDHTPHPTATNIPVANFPVHSFFAKMLPQKCGPVSWTIYKKINNLQVSRLATVC